jgi:acyl-Coa thioesterase superfamily protein/acyl-CoA thioesterase superfamily protein
MAGFDAATAVRLTGPVGEGSWTCAADVDADWRIMTKPNGGYLLALLARAAVSGPGGLPPHPLAVSAHFLGAPDLGPVLVHVELLRSGSTVTQLRATLLQGERRCVEGLVTLGRLRPAAAPWWDGVEAPKLPAEADCPRVSGDTPELPVPMLSVVEERLDPATTGWVRGRPGGSGELRGWLRHADGREPDPLSLLHAVDALPPATFDLGTAGWVPTLELTAYVRALPAPGPLVVRQRARLVDGGLVDEECDVWDAAGRLVATGHQLAGLRVPASPPVIEG